MSAPIEQVAFYSSMAAAVAQIAIAVFLLIGVPFAARRRSLRLVKELPFDAAARVRFYLRALAGAWIVTIIVLAAQRFGRGSGVEELALRAPSAQANLLGDLAWPISLAIALGLGLGVAQDFRRPEVLRAALLRVPESARAILPGTPAERRLWIAMSLTAGFCEELLYRSFLPSLLTSVFHGNAVAAWIVSTLAFGLGHAYQGPRAIVGTTVLGAIFATPTILLSSIWPAAVLHALFNMRAVAFPADVALPAGTHVPD